MKSISSSNRRSGWLLGQVALVLLGSFLGGAVADASNDRRALRQFKGPYAGSWTNDGMKLPLKLTMPKRGKGKGRGIFEATPCDSDDGLAPLSVKVTKFQLSRNGKKLVSRGKATWERSKNPRIGGPNANGPFKLVMKQRGRKPVATGKMTTGPKNGRVKLKKRGKLPPVPAPWMEMVWVGNPGNETDAGNTANPGVYGAVAKDFKIGKYEVTNPQYAEFLNAVASTDTNGLYAEEMGTDVRGGINRTGTPGNYSYVPFALMADKPVNFVNFWNACRFCNWLHHGRPTGNQGPSTTEDGAYDLTGDAIANNAAIPVARKAGARYFLPSEDQWYKAAYHDPRNSAQFGPPGDDYFWLYPTRSDVAPTVAMVDNAGSITNDSANLANYASGADWLGLDGHVTTVGSGGPESSNFYGIFDMAGNVWEWNEAVVIGSFRGLRGGSWLSLEDSLRSSNRIIDDPGNVLSSDGFRVASP